ncbi:MAG: hypothetical protein EBS17_05880 [Flavobacteriia bacterium]|nr:hypothetical protein [Flavobacteriia bacterium]
MPIIYTPTVGEACKSFSHVYTEAKGFYITPEHRGRIFDILDNWPSKNIKVIVVTDGERILGLGDLGANGMGISIGKLVLYSSCGGIDPSACLPVMIDIGTNNEELINDPLYLGVPERRISGEAYLAILDEFMEAVNRKFPRYPRNCRRSVSRYNLFYAHYAAGPYRKSLFILRRRLRCHRNC